MVADEGLVELKVERELKVKVERRREKEVQKAEVELGLHMMSDQHRGFGAGSVGHRAKRSSKMNVAPWLR